MPVHPGTDSKGSFFRWGGHGKKYYYTKGNKASMAAAKAKAAAQGRAAYAAGYKGNEMKLKIQRITANFTGGVRHDEMAGRKYLVAPMIMMVEGVHEGNHGPLLYPADELAKTPQIWNHKPVVVYHPQINGELGVSACDPIILSNRQVGVIMNTTVGEISVKVNNKNTKLPALKAEAWLEEDRMDKVDERIAEAVEKNQMMELSTGLFTDNETAEEDAEWNGEKYDAIARNYRPDHLALLPDLKGACSIEDGAGFLRLNAKPDKINIVGNEMSHGNIRSLLNSWLRDKDEDVWVEDVYDDYFVFMKDGKYFKGNYTVVDGTIEVSDVFTEIVRITEWRTLDGAFVGNEGESEIGIIAVENIGDGIDVITINPAIDVTEDYIRIRQKSPGLFKKGSMRTIWISKSKSIKAVIGRLKKPPKGSKPISTHVQSYLFVKEKWTTDRAKAWVKKHKGTVNVKDNDSKRKENIMEKEKVIDALIACNTNSWGEDDREILTEMDDDVLEKMQEGDKAAKTAVENAAKKGAKEATEKLTANQEDKTGEADTDKTVDADGNKATDADKTAADKESDKKSTENKKPKTTEEYISEAPKEIRNVLSGMLATHKTIKVNLIKRITDNEKNKFTAEELETKDLPELKKLVAMLPGDEKETESGLGLNFDGQGDVEDITKNTEEPLLMPAIVCAEAKK